MTVIVAALGWSWRETEVDPLTGEVSASRRDRGPSRSDLAALEHALRLADRWDARVVAATVGPAEADAMLRDALAAGAVQALRVEPASWTAGPRPAGMIGGGQESAAALAAALREYYGVPDLVLCGDRSDDRGTGSFPAFLAAALGAAQALGCVRLEPADDRALRVHRRLDGGRREVLLARRPAVVSVEAAGVRLRRAGLPATLASANAAITVARGSAATAAQRFGAAPNAGADRGAGRAHAAHCGRPAVPGSGRRRTARIPASSRLPHVSRTDLKSGGGSDGQSDT
jgi:electron transfer flavoprotein beta subunit